MESQFKYVGVWGDASGLTNLAYIYHELHPQFELRMKHTCPGSSGPEQERYYAVVKALVALLNAGIEAKPELLAPYISRETTAEAK